MSSAIVSKIRHTNSLYYYIEREKNRVRFRCKVFPSLFRVFSGAVVLEGLCVTFDRAEGKITFEESVCGPPVTLQEVHNPAGEYEREGTGGFWGCES